MIDPVRITGYNRSVSELEELILFCIAVANKTASTTAVLLERFLTEHRKSPNDTPFDIIRSFEDQESIKEALKRGGFGCYTLKSRGFYYIANSNIDLKSCTWQDLDICPGVSLKTSKFFILHTRRNAKIACLDTHILKWLKEKGHKVPKTSPQSEKVYQKIEEVFLGYAKAGKISPAKLDLSIWNLYAKKETVN